jgi:hypothetical protein
MREEFHRVALKPNYDIKRAYESPEEEAERRLAYGAKYLAEHRDELNKYNREYGPQHYQKHKALRKFMCEACEVGFASSSNLSSRIPDLRVPFKLRCQSFLCPLNLTRSSLTVLPTYMSFGLLLAVFTILYTFEF